VPLRVKYCHHYPKIEREERKVQIKKTESELIQLQEEETSLEQEFQSITGNKAAQNYSPRKSNMEDILSKIYFPHQ
jgi:outer membrane protein TolC